MPELRAVLALLPGRELENRLSAAALALHAAAQGRLRWPRLPLHLSLVQPFEVGDLQALEQRLTVLAAKLAPASAVLGQVEQRASSADAPDTAVWVGVEGSPTLRALQRRLSFELHGAPPGAAPEVDAHGFHLTLGFLPAPVPQLEAAVPAPGFAGLTATFEELALHLYDGLPRAGWQSLAYRRLPLLGSSSPSSARAGDPRPA